uniref:Putative ovule protein n=1 Tax=Solanum chacoense TaxID=4108 RepID=A0A0V0HHW6_SOLCH
MAPCVLSQWGQLVHIVRARILLFLSHDSQFSLFHSIAVCGIFYSESLEENSDFTLNSNVGIFFSGAEQ